MTTIPGQGALRQHRHSDTRPRSGSAFTVLSGGKGRRRGFWLAIFGGALLVLVAAILLIASLSYRQKIVVQDLEEATGTRLQIKNFRQTYLPHPGCVIEGLTFALKGPSQAAPLISIRKLTVSGSYLRLFAHHVPLMKAEGMHVVVPALGTAEFYERKKSKTVVGQFMTEGAVLDFSRREPGQSPLRFLIHRFVIHELASGRSMKFESSLTNPEPPGEVRLAGSLGPWKDGNPEQTPLQGTYTFERANLGAFAGIAGTLSSTGKFAGTFKQLSVEGSTDSPDFEVQRSGHKTHLSTKFQAEVDALNGDVTLRKVKANFWKTHLEARGMIAGNHQVKGKTAVVEIAGREGRIEDLMMLFISEKKSPIVGLVSFVSRSAIPPDEGPFLKKILFEADFGIDAANLTNPERQESMERLSERARGNAEKADDEEVSPDRVLSDLKGHVQLKNGTATFSNLTFSVPGATARMHGTYDLFSERINLHGTLRMAKPLSKTTTGVKSFLLKVISPFTHKEKPAAPIPVSITGTWDHPEYHVSIK